MKYIELVRKAAVAYGEVIVSLHKRGIRLTPEEAKKIAFGLRCFKRVLNDFDRRHENN